MDGLLYPGDAEFTSASRFYGSVHRHWNIFKLAIFQWNTTVGNTALKSGTEKEVLSEWGPGKILMETVQRLKRPTQTSLAAGCSKDKFSQLLHTSLQKLAPIAAGWGTLPGPSYLMVCQMSELQLYFFWREFWTWDLWGETISAERGRTESCSYQSNFMFQRWTLLPCTPIGILLVELSPLSAYFVQRKVDFLPVPQAERLL